MVTCSKCHKPLTDPVSVESEMGPICRSREKIREALRDAQRGDKMIFISRPINDGIILAREDGKVATNVPWTCVSGSPDGFEWGYGGSGPSDLALNIVEAVLRRVGYKGPRTQCFKGDCFNLAYSLRYEFKVKYLAGLDREGAILDYAPIKDWVITKVMNENVERKGYDYEYKTR